MNKQEFINDLIELQKRKKHIEGAIQYVIGKVREFELKEQEELKKKLIEKQEEESKKKKDE